MFRLNADLQKDQPKSQKIAFPFALARFLNFCNGVSYSAKARLVNHIVHNRVILQVGGIKCIRKLDSKEQTKWPVVEKVRAFRKFRINLKQIETRR